MNPNRAANRASSLDTLRGAAMVWMTVFHACFDLASFGYWQQNFYADPFWTWQRNAIVTLFFLCAGVAQALAVDAGQSWARFWKRWLQIAACAVAVSAGSYWMYPKSFIYFGVLHHLCVGLVVLRVLLHVPALAKNIAWLGLASVALWWLASQALPGSVWESLFNSKPLNVLGIISAKPITEDYVPLLPWFGVLCVGAALGRWFDPLTSNAAMRQNPVMLFLAGLGRWSLSYYMVHQPVLIGLLMAWGSMG